MFPYDDCLEFRSQSVDPYFIHYHKSYPKISKNQQNGSDFDKPSATNTKFRQNRKPGLNMILFFCTELVYVLLIFAMHNTFHAIKKTIQK